MIFCTDCKTAMLQNLRTDVVKTTNSKILNTFVSGHFLLTFKSFFEGKWKWLKVDACTYRSKMLVDDVHTVYGSMTFERNLIVLLTEN